MDVRFTHGEFDGVCHDLFREERLSLGLGYGVVFVAHRKISFVSCMEGSMECDPIFFAVECCVFVVSFIVDHDCII